MLRIMKVPRELWPEIMNVTVPVKGAPMGLKDQSCCLPSSSSDFWGQRPVEGTQSLRIPRLEGFILGAAWERWGGKQRKT